MKSKFESRGFAVLVLISFALGGATSFATQLSKALRYWPMTSSGGLLNNWVAILGGLRLAFLIMNLDLLLLRRE